MATLSFEPTKPPEVRFEATGDIDVDEQGLWSDIVGAVATVIGKDPEEREPDLDDLQAGLGLQPSSCDDRPHRGERAG